MDLRSAPSAVPSDIAGQSAARERLLVLLAGLSAVAACVALFGWRGWSGAWPAAGSAALAVAALAARRRRLLPQDLLLIAAACAALGASAHVGLKPWAVPTAWRELLWLTPFGAASIGALLLMLTLPRSAAADGRPAWPMALAVLSLPYLFNLLLLLASPAMTGVLGRWASLAHASQWGRAMVLWLIAEALVLGVGAVMDRRLPRGLRIHGLLLIAALWTAWSPVVADLASTPALATAPAWLQLPAVVAGAALAQAGLWALTFLLTNVLLDALHGRRPDWESSWTQWRGGLLKGAVYGAVFMLLIHAAALLLKQPAFQQAVAQAPLLVGAVLGPLCFGLARTLVESFDGSPPFFKRLAASYREPMNALRGLIAGLGLALLLHAGLATQDSAARFLYAALIGAAAYGGADLLRDLYAMLRGRRQRPQRLRIYLFGAVLGGLLAGALGWYFDAPQLQVVVDKFHRYAAVQFAASGSAGFDSVVYPLFSKWGAIPLGHIDGGVALFYSESLGGVINWAIAAPLFSLNLVALTALFQRSLKPLRELLTPAGITGVVEQTVRVLRWGPWMAPIISSFLRMAPQPSWYNQDGAIRTVAAIGQSFHLSGDAFRSWGRDVFLGLLAYDWLRILIWFDHMGLRVATLVNLSFVGADALDEKAARSLGHAGRTRVIPEGIRRFLTWAPLLIPFYIPRGGDWDYAWNGAEQLANHPQAPLLPAVVTLVHVYVAAALVLLAVAAVLAAALRRRQQQRRGVAATPAVHRLSNGQYTLELDADGRGYAHVRSTVRPNDELDLTRKPDDPQQLRGKFFFLRELNADGAGGSAWALTREPLRRADADYRFRATSPTRLVYGCRCAGIDAQAEVVIDAGAALERWTLRLRNLESRARLVELSSYQEFAVGPTDQYRRTPFFAAMHVGTAWLPQLGAILARNRLLHTAAPGQHLAHEVAFHAVGRSPGVTLTGYQDSRSAFIGGGTLRAPDALNGAALREPADAGLLYSFDPAASLRLQVELAAGATVEIPFVDGYARDEAAAAALIAECLGRPPLALADLQGVLATPRQLAVPPLPPGYDGDAAFSADGRELRVPTDAQRPWTHVLANPLGHGLIVGGDGELFSFAGNAQQNGLSAFGFDAVPAQTPAQLIYVCDLDSGDIDTPAYVPLRRNDAQRSATFGLGWARHTQRRGALELTQTVFVPPSLPLDMRLLVLRNHGERALRLRIAPYVDVMLGETTVDSRDAIETRTALEHGALLFRRPGNDFRKGWAFVATSLDVNAHETVRTRYFGRAGDASAPQFVVAGRGDAGLADDGRRVAALAGEIRLAPGAELALTLLVGQVGDPAQALALIDRWRPVAAVRAALDETCAWWNGQLSVLRVETNRPDVDRLVNDWLPYQLLTARLWGRSGPQQRSGAYGYRDQLQDVLPLALTDPPRARSQILLHARQQFREGDAPKWWHPAWDGGTGICVRTAASDPHLWLPYVVIRYVRATGDVALLDECVPFMEAPPLPKGQEGRMFVPRPSQDAGSIDEHCRRAIDWSLARFGRNGLPLLGSGDWNDGIDLPGLLGRGESVWLGFFLHGILQDYAALLRRRGRDAADYTQAAARLRQSLDRQWRDGRGYLRATTDDGEDFDSCDALISAWPALSGAVERERALAAIELGLAKLQRENRVLLLTPPFSETSRPYPGRIAEYPPGVRENGGQYSHGASWLVDALLCCAAGATADEAAALRARAFEVWLRISPLSKCGADNMAVYGLPPHQQPADVYDGAGHAGRGGWAWYTGAAARMLSAAYALLGIDLQDGELKLNAPPPADGSLVLRGLQFRGQRIIP